MPDEPIIQAMLDNDFYKVNMMQAIFHRFPDVNVEYEFKLRHYEANENLEPLIPEIQAQIKHLCTLRFQKDELDYLRKFPWLTENFIEYLRLFQLNESYIKVWYDPQLAYEGGYYGKLRVSIRGSWLNTILFEVPVLAIITELISKERLKSSKVPFEGAALLAGKVAFVQAQRSVGADRFQIADFGTRRRFSREWQGSVLARLQNGIPKNFIGTSNMHFARLLDVKPIGTQAHEWFMAMQALTRVSDSQKFALEEWVQEYRGSLGIALTDTICMGAFLKDFDLYFAKLFDGCRQDSGNPAEWTEKLIAHYKRLGIDPMTKTAVYSNNLDFRLAWEIYWRFRERINTSFGIGTYITNDVGISAPQCVIKMTRCNCRPVAKISDDTGKSMCPDENYVDYLRQQFGLRCVLQ